MRLPITLLLPQAPTRNTLIDRNIRSLRANFVTSTRQLNQASWTAMYLHAVGEIFSARELLESFVGEVEYDGDESRWGSVGNAIVLLSHIYFHCDSSADAASLMNRIRANELWATDRGRAAMMDECLAEHDDELLRASKETQVYACEILASRLFDYYYLEQSHRNNYQDLTDSQLERLTAAIDEARSALTTNLLN